MPNRQLSLLYSRQKIAAEIQRLAGEINRDYANRELLVVGVLKGSFLFIADLVRQLNMPVTIDFVRLASYGSDTLSSGIVEFRKDLEISIQNKDILIVEDIVDSGLTLDTLYQHLILRKPSSIKICTLINKTALRQGDVKPDYTGLTMESGFIVGYGLDFDEKYRNLPDIYIMKEA